MLTTIAIAPMAAYGAGISLIPGSAPPTMRPGWAAREDASTERSRR